MAFVCSICEEQSTRICVRCTKDTCANHLCEKCGACSDCCDCDIRLEPDTAPHETAAHEVSSVSAAGPHDPDEPRPHPMPDPDPAPDPDPMPHADSDPQ
jgi:hypothetical protein